VICPSVTLAAIMDANKVKLKGILERERMGWYGLDRSGSGQRPMEDSCEHGNEPSGSIKCWEVLE
jgi:hypothetical protein